MNCGNNRLIWCVILLIAIVRPAFAQDAAIDSSTADAEPAVARIDPADTPADRFVAPSPTMNRSATLELRPDATIFGAAIHLKQLCRWSGADAPTMTPVADLTVAQFAHGSRSKTISLNDLRTTLQDAGVNLAAVRFEGSLSCTVTRGDSDAATADGDSDRAVLQQWIDSAAASSTHATVTAPLKGPTAAADTSPVRTLRDLLLQDLSQRLNMPVDTFDVSFDPKDQSALNLSEPNFHFDVRARRVHDLGDVSWSVTILTGASTAGQQKVIINAQARAWQNQLVLVRSVSYGQVLREEDVEARRVLIDSTPDSPVLGHDQVVGQQAARDLQTGTVMTARLVQAVPLARAGQYITITLNCGSVQIRTVARAMEGGSYGQAIKVKDEATREQFEVTLVAPQQATMGAAPAESAPMQSARAAGG